jgi:hypothetical protein
MPNLSLEEIRECCYKFSENSAEAKKRALIRCSHTKWNTPKEILAYHDLLLFLLAYPEDEQQFKLALHEMFRLADIIKDLSPAKKEKLELSGLVFTLTHGGFSIRIIKWLLKEFPEQVYIHSFDEEGVHPREVLKHALPEMEFEITSDEKLKPMSWLAKVSGTRNKHSQLNWLIHHLQSCDAPELILDQLFDQLKLYITIDPFGGSFSRSFGKVTPDKIFYHNNGLLKKFDEQALINKKLPAPKKLSDHEKKNIISVSRVALCLLNRETDPITYCNEEGLLVYDLEHGLSIALFSMLPERRLPLESYIGFMMFKNGYPMAYGGGWLFGKRSLLGINIFGSFRGGESAFVFAQLLRTYKNAFGADYFEVEPYQFGKDNPEGLQSGAFWFYYRFGFRPVDDKLHQLATQEHQKILSDKNYRSSIPTLKQFTNSNVAAYFSGKTKPVNPSDISRFITKTIVERFGGDRNAAEKFCYAKIKKELKVSGLQFNVGMKKLALFYGLCIETEKLNTVEKNKWRELVLQKGLDEYKYIKLCAQVRFRYKHFA